MPRTFQADPEAQNLAERMFYERRRLMHGQIDQRAGAGTGLAAKDKASARHDLLQLRAEIEKNQGAERTEYAKVAAQHYKDTQAVDVALAQMIGHVTGSAETANAGPAAENVRAREAKYQADLTSLDKLGVKSELSEATQGKFDKFLNGEGAENQDGDVTRPKARDLLASIDRAAASPTDQPSKDDLAKLGLQVSDLLASVKDPQERSIIVSQVDDHLKNAGVNLAQIAGGAAGGPIDTLTGQIIDIDQKEVERRQAWEEKNKAVKEYVFRPGGVSNQSEAAVKAFFAAREKLDNRQPLTDADRQTLATTASSSGDPTVADAGKRFLEDSAPPERQSGTMSRIDKELAALDAPERAAEPEVVALRRDIMNSKAFGKFVQDNPDINNPDAAFRAFMHESKRRMQQGGVPGQIALDRPRPSEIVPTLPGTHDQAAPSDLTAAKRGADTKRPAPTAGAGTAGQATPTQAPSFVAASNTGFTGKRNQFVQNEVARQQAAVGGPAPASPDWQASGGMVGPNGTVEPAMGAEEQDQRLHATGRFAPPAPDALDADRAQAVEGQSIQAGVSMRLAQQRKAEADAAADAAADAETARIKSGVAYRNWANQ